LLLTETLNCLYNLE